MLYDRFLSFCKDGLNAMFSLIRTMFSLIEAER